MIQDRAEYDTLLGLLEQIQANLLTIQSPLLLIQHRQQETRMQLAWLAAWVGSVVRWSREGRSPSPVRPPDAGQDEAPRREGPAEEEPRRSGRKRRMTERARAAQAEGMQWGWMS